MGTTTKETKPNGVSSTALAIPTTEALPVQFAADLEQFDGAGLGTRPEEQLVPFIGVLQKGSPQVNERDPAYVPGAKPGMLLCTSTNRLWDAEHEDTPAMVQAYSEMCEIEWIPRSAGGGFVAKHPIDTPLVKQIREEANPQNPTARAKIRLLPSGNQLVTTAMHYVILTDTLEPAIISLSSTGLQTHRRWNQMLLNKRVRTPSGLRVMPSFATMLKLRTFWQKNDSGDWFSIEVMDAGWVTDPIIYDEAKRIFQLASNGSLRVSNPTSENEEETTGTPVTTDIADEIPF